MGVLVCCGPPGLVPVYGSIGVSVHFVHSGLVSVYRCIGALCSFRVSFGISVYQCTLFILGWFRCFGVSVHFAFSGLVSVHQCIGVSVRCAPSGLVSVYGCIGALCSGEKKHSNTAAIWNLNQIYLTDCRNLAILHFGISLFSYISLLIFLHKGGPAHYPNFFFFAVNVFVGAPAACRVATC